MAHGDDGADRSRRTAGGGRGRSDDDGRGDGSRPGIARREFLRRGAVAGLSLGVLPLAVRADEPPRVRRQVRLGRTDGSDVQILKGLAPGDRLVLTGGYYLKPGDRVTVASTRQAGTP